MNVDEAKIAVLEALGIDPKGVTAAVIQFDHASTIEVTLWVESMDFDPTRFETEVREFELVEKKGDQ